LLAGVDKVSIALLLGREPLDSKHAVLTLKGDVDSLVEEVGAESGDADAQVHEHAVLELLGSAPYDALAANLGVALAGNLGRLAGNVQSLELNALL